MNSPQDDSDSSHSVKLYAYDLSNGLARSMSLGWTGRQFEAIWHTSVVYDNQVEIFFGQGITTCSPGQSHHGKPLKIMDLGSTMIDPQTLMEYIDGLRQTWTADVYHLLERNCNHFSNELVGFLNGASVPDYILNLPQEFLATPLGASMRPMIEQMFRGTNPVPSGHQLPTAPSVQTPAHLLADVASSAYSRPTDLHLVSCSTVTAFDKELTQHHCVVANFTNERGCPPCRVIAPIYEELARKYHSTPTGSNAHHGHQHKAKDIKFIKVDTATSMELSQRFQIRATPTFKFFINKKEVGEMKGANQTELETQINLMVYTAYPPHSHLKLKLPKIKALSPSPILYPQVFNFDKALNKLLESFPQDGNSPREVIKQTFEWVVIPFLSKKTDLNSPDRFLQWARATTQVLDSLGSSDSFPALDFLRLAVLREEYVDQLFICPPESNPLYEAIRVGTSQGQEGGTLARPFSLTLLRLISNALGSPKLAEQMMEMETKNQMLLLRFVVGRLLDGDVDVQVLASGVFYGLVSRWASNRVEWVGPQHTSEAGVEEEWEIESMSALIESLDREAKNAEPNPEMTYRLIATIGKLIYLSPSSASLTTLLESLGFPSTIKSLMTKPGLSKANNHPAIQDLCKELQSLM